MALNRAIISRRFSWRAMIACTLVGAIVAVIQGQWAGLAALPFSLGAILALHPMMDIDVPTLVDRAMLRRRRTWLGIAFLVFGSVVLLALQIHLLT